MCVRTCLCMCVCVCACLPVRVSACPCVCLSVCAPVRVSARACARLSPCFALRFTVPHFSRVCFLHLPSLFLRLRCIVHAPAATRFATLQSMWTSTSRTSPHASSVRPITTTSAHQTWLCLTPFGFASHSNTTATMTTNKCPSSGVCASTAMSFPASGLQATYRNSLKGRAVFSSHACVPFLAWFVLAHTHTHTHTHIPAHTHTHSHTLSRPLSTSLLTSLCCLCADVAAMLRSRHADNYLVFNVSEKEYDISKLNNQVLDFGWPDHMAPPLERLCRCVAIALCLWLFVCCSFIGWPVTGAQRRETHPRTHTHTHTPSLSLSHTHTHTHTLTHTFWPQLSGAASSTRWDHGWTAILPTLLLCTAKAARAERALLLLRISATSESLTSASTLLLLLLLHTRARTHTHAHTHTHPLISTPALCLTSRFP